MRNRTIYVLIPVPYSSKSTLDTHIIEGNRFLSGFNPRISRGRGGEKKIRGRSPVPLSGTIIEPHTDKFPDLFLLLLFLSSLSVGSFSRIKFPGGWGLKESD